MIDEKMRQRGFDRGVVHQLKHMLADAGFVDVVEQKFPLPWGTWPKNKKLKTIGYWQNGTISPANSWPAVRNFDANINRTTQARTSRRISRISRKRKGIHCTRYRELHQ